MTFRVKISKVRLNEEWILQQAQRIYARRDRERKAEAEKQNLEFHELVREKLKKGAPQPVWPYKSPWNPWS